MKVYPVTSRGVTGMSSIMQRIANRTSDGFSKRGSISDPLATEDSLFKTFNFGPALNNEAKHMHNESYQSESKIEQKNAF